MQLIQTVAPLTEPLTLEEVKEFLRVLDNDSDTLISALIIAVREYVENITNRQLEVATFEIISEDLFSQLPKGSLKSVEKIEYLDEALNYVEFDTSKYYTYINNGIGYISFSEAPTIQDHKQAVKVTFVCGYDVVPEAIKAYMKVKISTLFENREQFVIGASISDFGSGFIENLLSPYKIRNI